MLLAKCEYYVDAIIHVKFDIERMKLMSLSESSDIDFEEYY